MASRFKVAVFTESGAGPFWHFKRDRAADLVASGKAVITGEKSIRMVSKKPYVKSSRILHCGQGSIYESAASDKHPQFFQGGLTRTESNPARVPKFKAARVGHQ